MIVKNETLSLIISDDAKFAQGLLDRTFGLLRQSNPRTLIFKTRFGVHTFGLKKPIDVLVINHQNKVIVLKSNLKPNRLFFWNPRYNL
ncbi:MAG: hypothetical protein ACD_30C00031G0001, partial [uncultured bacterium]